MKPDRHSISSRQKAGAAVRRKQQIAIWILVYPDFVLLDAAGPAQVFATANDEASDAGLAPPYRISLVSKQGGAVVSAAGVSVLTQPLPSMQTLRGATLIVSGGSATTMQASISDSPLVHWIVRASQHVGRCCSVCTGALLLAQGGLLNRRNAVTHWKDVEQLRRYPQVQVHDDAIYVKDGSIYTSAGVTAGIDLCLSLVEEDFGRALALNVAKRLVVSHKRSGGQRQFSSELMAQFNAGDLLAQLTQWLKPRLQKRIDIAQMAVAVSLSVRTLHRRLRDEAGLSPAQLLARLRIDAACKLLEAQRLSIKQVAGRAGFRSEYNLRRAFAARLGVLPSEYRTRFG